MRYKDGTNSVNGYYIGVPTGARLADALAPGDDGMDHLRGASRIGTTLGDAADPAFPEILTESGDTGNGKNIELE